MTAYTDGQFDALVSLPTILEVVRSSVQHCAVKSTVNNMPKCQNNSCAGSGRAAANLRGWFGVDMLRPDCTQSRLKTFRAYVSASSNQVMCGPEVYKTQPHGYGE